MHVSESESVSVLSSELDSCSLSFSESMLEWEIQHKYFSFSVVFNGDFGEAGDLVTFIGILTKCNVFKWKLLKYFKQT